MIFALIFSYMITSFSSWTFFVLLNAYYGGALTMFFTSEVTIPFNNIYDVMKAYPTWKLKMRAGEEVRYQYKGLAIFKEIIILRYPSPKTFKIFRK